MNRSDLVNNLSENFSDLSADKIEDITKHVFEFMSKVLVDGGRIEIRGFGTFSTKERAARTARNPKTGESVQVPAKKAVHFKPGKELKDRVNN